MSKRQDLTILEAAIKACGHKKSALAEKLGLEASNITQWKNRGIPRWHRDAVLEIARGRK